MSIEPYPGSGGGAVADGMLRRYGFRGIPGWYDNRIVVDIDKSVEDLMLKR